ncbi:hypothetical protein [Prosthecobacter sp.]|uniref:hypothetical protein n=1 Tax=Prosthecobacter sp. TaxID=1965333 RepID=UPI00378345D6
MLAKSDIEFALSIQNRCFKLLLWLGNAIREGFVPLIKAHDLAGAGHAARSWVETHFYNLPDECRPLSDELTPFANFFGTYLETSFDLVARPKERYFSSCGCFCPWCSRLAQAQHLKPKALTREDKERAAKLRLRRMEMIAREEKLPSYELRIKDCLSDESLRIQASLSAYGAALLNRLKGISDGPAVLALWRDFAWSSNGAPLRRFKLQSKHILEAEQRLLGVLQNHAGL